ncbi:4499_t:CDS:2, partial [Dentiscutata heterogama]
SYAYKFKHLLSKVDADKGIPAPYVMRMFLKRLRGNIAVLLSLAEPNNLDNAIVIARRIEAEDKNYVKSEVLANDQARRHELEEQPQEPLPMNEEPYISEEPTVTRSKYRKRPSRVDNLEPYNVVQDLLNTKFSVTIEQMLKYPNQCRNLVQALRRPRLPVETNYAQPKENLRTTAARCYIKIRENPVVAILDTSAAVSL